MDGAECVRVPAGELGAACRAGARRAQRGVGAGG